MKTYVTNLGKYNEGYLIGKWIDLPIDEDEFKDVLKSIGVSDEPDKDGNYYEEYFFTDYDDAPAFVTSGSMCGEYEPIEKLNEIAEYCDKYGVDLLDAIADATSNDWDRIKDTIDDGRYHVLYVEDKDDESLGYALAEETGDVDNLPEFGQRYFDYESYGRDYRLDTTGEFCTIDGNNAYLETY